jgi:hypothetical protein
MTEDDRRRVERVTFSDPPPARINGEPAKLLDLGMLGARIRHERPLPAGADARVEFEYDGDLVKALGRITRCDFQQVLSEARGERIFVSAVEFTSADPSSAGSVKRIISNHVARALEAQKANARGALAALGADVPFLRESGEGGKVKRAASHSYVSCRPGPGGTWRKTILARPVQPADGFTVRLGDSEEEVDRLCQAWNEATPEVRKLIRICAEMSTVDDEESLPPQNFTP